ncbi:MAG: hypothetical protein ACJAVI_005591 [Candidatus Azotimanducaceae bacterium]
MLVDSAIEIFPFAFDLYIGLRDAGPIKPPAKANPFLIFAKGLFDSRCTMHDPALNGTMIYSVPSLMHQFLQAEIAQSISHRPTDAL